MMKEHKLEYLILDHIEIRYFYIREKNDRNGNARYRVFITDPEAPAVYETIFKCYECEIAERVRFFIEDSQ